MNFSRPKFKFDRQCTRIPMALCFASASGFITSIMTIELSVDRILTSVVNALKFQRPTLLLYFNFLDFGWPSLVRLCYQKLRSYFSELRSLVNYNSKEHTYLILSFYHSVVLLSLRLRNSVVLLQLSVNRN